MRLEADGSAFCFPCASQVTPRKRDRHDNHQVPQPCRIGHMGTFQVESLGLETAEERLDAPVLQILPLHFFGIDQDTRIRNSPVLDRSPNRWRSIPHSVRFILDDPTFSFGEPPEERFHSDLVASS